MTYPILKQQAKSRVLLDTSQYDLNDFTHIYSTSQHHRIVDTHGNILAYRYQIPDNLYDQLVASEAILPTVQSKATVRGAFQHRHYALWKDYTPKPFPSAEYCSQLPNSQQWLDANAALFKRLSENLRFIDPYMYVKFNSVRKYLPANTQPLCGAWFGVAINQGQTDETSIHQDWGDYYRGYNTVVPWGDYTDGQLILWQLKVMYHLASKDVLMFYGRLIAHNVIGIEGGIRNSLDLFCHENVFRWKKEEDRKRRGIEL